MSAASYGRRRSRKKPIFKKKVFWYAVLAIVLMVFAATALQLLDNRSVEAAWLLKKRLRKLKLGKI